MGHPIYWLIIVAILCAPAALCESSAYRDLYADTWVATDALGRTMPGIDEAGPVKDDQRRVVGIFYITWHSDNRHHLRSPYTADVTKILEQDPDARLDGAHPLWTEGAYHWAEPEMGYFLSRDAYVVRKDMSMLADAGVDVLIMDVTNAVRYWDEWEVVFSTMEQMKAAGNKVPQFCFWSYNGPSITVVQDLYERIYVPEKYKDLWFYWDGKPLLLYNGTPAIDANGQDIQHPNPNYDEQAKTDPNHPHYNDPEYCEAFYQDYTRAVKTFFTLRTMWWGYYTWAGKRAVGTENYWSFGYDLGDERVRSMAPDDLLSLHEGVREQATVTPAQHSSTMIGKSWSRDTGEPPLNDYDLPVPTYVPWLDKTVEGAEGYGIYFQERWEEALHGDPQFLYINDWNEWSAGKYPFADGGTGNFLGRKSNFFFVDQFNAEFNRGIQPMKGGYTDNYYMQMAQNIRRYKGVRPIPQAQGYAAISIDGNFQDWDAVTPEYRDTVGDTAHRDYKGYGQLHYTDQSGRNDIITAKVAVDEAFLYFYVAANEPLSPHTDPNWMLLLIDADQRADTGWFGYDYLINKSVEDEKHTTIARYTQEDSGGAWTVVDTIAYRCGEKELELALPRSLLGLTDTQLSIDFHWADNPKDLKDPISLCTHGDSAPNRRFNYRYLWKE